MGLFSFIFGKKKDNGPAPSVTTQGVPVFSPIFTASQSKEANATFMNCVASNARNFSKIVPTLVYKDEPSDRRRRLLRILQYKPNPRQNAATFWRTVGKSYFLNNVALIWPEYDFTYPNDPIRALWPIDISAGSFQIAVTSSGKLVVKFMANGLERYEWLEDLIVLEREVNLNGNFGGFSAQIDQTVQVLSTASEGIISTITAANYVQYICSINHNVSPDALKARQKEADSLWFDQKSRVIMVNGGETLQRVEPRGTIPAADAIKVFKEDLYAYENTNEKIVQGTYNEDEWQAYYESCLEPLVNELSQELTNKLFTESEFFHGNRVEIRADPLQTASLKTRCAIVNALKGVAPVIVPNDLLKLLYLPTFEGGDKPMQTLNFVDADKANGYQGVGQDEEPKEDKEGEKDA